MTFFSKYGLLIQILIGLFFSTPAQSQEIKIVGNPVGPPDQLTLNELRTIFKAQRQWWSNDTKISIVLLKSSAPISATVANKIYGMTQNEVKTYWIQIVFRGKAATPKHFETEQSIISYIASTPGAIGVVNAATNTSELKTIKIDGKEMW